MIPLIPRVSIAGLQKKRTVRQDDAEAVLVRGVPPSDNVLPDLRHAAIGNRLLKKTRELKQTNKGNSKFMKDIKKNLMAFLTSIIIK